MAGKADFSPEEWQQVLGGMFLAGFAVSAAEPSGLWGMLKETFASGRAVLEARATAGDNALMKAIVADFQTSEGRSDAQKFVKERLEGAKGEELKQRAIEAVRQAAATVEQKAPLESHGIQRLVAQDRQQGCRGRKGRRILGNWWRAGKRRRESRAG